MCALVPSVLKRAVCFFCFVKGFTIAITLCENTATIVNTATAVLLCTLGSGFVNVT